MFCSECGKECAGKFCWNCGAPLSTGTGHTSEAGSEPNGTSDIPHSTSVDWQNEVEYAQIIKASEVRDVLAKQVPTGVQMSGEAFADSFNTVLHAPIPFSSMMAMAQDIDSRLGIHTGKSETEQYSRPVGRIIACALCAVAKEGYKVKDVHQASDGCVLICEIPSDMFSFAGQLIITIERTSNGASLQARTSIEGQLYDWGKSKRCLNGLVDGIATFDKVFT